MPSPGCVSLGLISPAAASARAPVSDIRLDGVAPEVAAAVRTAQTAVVADPRSAATWLTLGMVCEANGLFAEARRAYEHATSLDDRQAQAWYRLAVVRGRGGQTDEALAALDRAIALDGSYAPAHWRRGLWLLDPAKDDEARAAFEKATTLDPSNPGRLGRPRAGGAPQAETTPKAVEAARAVTSRSTLATAMRCACWAPRTSGSAVPTRPTMRWRWRLRASRSGPTRGAMSCRRSASASRRRSRRPPRRC